MSNATLRALVFAATTTLAVAAGGTAHAASVAAHPVQAVGAPSATLVHWEWHHHHRFWVSDHHHDDYRR